jgi:cytochrome c oxidase assembly protein subunit 11
MTTSDGTPPSRSRRRHIAPLLAISIVCVMIGLVAVSPSLYRAFCAATGYEGTPRIGTSTGLKAGKRILHVRFDANVGSGLPWRFEPEMGAIDLRTGKTATVFYKVTNTTDETITARAIYNVGPPSIGAYFIKIACFCFSDQTLKPHETLEMPVVFYLDPALESDETMAGVDEVILSYTFYRQKSPHVASGGSGNAPL